MIQTISTTTSEGKTEKLKNLAGGMATANSEATSSSALSRCRYQVFLSFKGEDTRKNFTDHLYTALVQAGIHAFRDDDEIGRGENIKLEIKRAIRQSKIAIILFSEGYACSRWCLDELLMIMEQRRTAGCEVLPVFYHVDPCDVSEQTGSFARAFVEHEKRFEKEIERVDGWRNALKEVADLAGLVLGDRHEATFVQSIVQMVSKKLNRTRFHLPQHFIGRDALMKTIYSWLRSGSSGGAIAMIYGIGGIGKSAIAKSIYNKNSVDFEAISFLANIRERSKESNGFVCLQRQLLSDILNKSISDIHDVDEGIKRIEDAFCCRRVLIILDDVDTKDQFNTLVKMENWLCKGSKIIVTTRNKGLFAGYQQCVKFKVEALNEKESIELFSWHAFQKTHPVQDYIEHSKSMVRLCDGLPLALTVMGSTLSGKTTKVWESALQEMEMIPNCDILKVLKISYDSLNDDYQKNLFLDIACFFVGMDEDFVVTILSGLGIDPTFSIDNLKDRCLVEIDQLEKRISMHQLIKDMGREIARQESSKFQRIWHHMEAFGMLENITDTERVRGLILDMHELVEHTHRRVVHCKDPLESSIVHHKRSFTGQYCPPPGFFSWKRFSSIVFRDGQTSLFPLLGDNAFKKMQNIKFLQLNYVKFVGCFEQFPKSLLWLCWHGFSLTSIPKSFCLEKLVVLDMRYSKLVDVWKGKMLLPELKILNLSHSHSLRRTPDFKGLECLETLILEDCINLVNIHESIGGLHSLAFLNLRGCTRLEELPEEISKLNSLEELILEGCSNLDGLNIKLFQQLQRRWSLHRDGIVASTSHMIIAMPLTLVSHFWLAETKKWRLSTSILPRSLVELDLSRTLIRCLPESIRGLTSLNKLWLTNCIMLQTIPELPTSVAELDLQFCYSLEKVAHLVPSMVLFGCNPLQVQDWIKQELIEVADIHMFRLLEIACRNQPSIFLVILRDNVFHSCIYGVDCSRIFEEKWPNEVRLSPYTRKVWGSKLYTGLSPYTRKLWGLRLCTGLRFAATTFSYESCLFVEIKNIEKGGRKSTLSTLSCYLVELLLIPPKENGQIMWSCHWVFRAGGLEFEDGDEVIVCVGSNDPAIQLAIISVETMHEEKGNEKKESNNDITTFYNSSVWNQPFCYEHVSEKEQKASSLFGKYECVIRESFAGLRQYRYGFRLRILGSTEETNEELS